jgi:hypothetical protein
MKLEDEYVFIQWKALERKWAMPILLYYPSISKLDKNFTGMQSKSGVAN